MNQKQIDKKVEKCAYIVSQLIIASFDLSKDAEQSRNYLISPEIILQSLIEIFNNLD